MDKSAIRALTERQRLVLCDQLDTLSAEQFDADSLCRGWRVRDVLGHLVSIVELKPRKFMAFTPAGLDRAFDKRAKQLGSRDPRELVRTYRALADTFMLVNPAGRFANLSDVVTHALDIAVPLDLDSSVLPDAKPLVLDALVAGPWYTGLGMRLFRGRTTGGFTLIADDVDWARGTGPEVSAPAEQLILAVTGRPVDTSTFEGDGVAQFLTSTSP